MLKPFSKAQLAFDLIAEIGHAGANSKAFIAYDHQLGAEIVIKQIAKDTLDLGMFYEESKILYLSGHPNVVQIYYACEDDDNVYLAMPYYREGSIGSLIQSRFLTVREVVALSCQICSGLHNIHSKKLIHFDVKPSNVLISARGEALLSDFGQAKRQNNSGIAGQDRLYQRMRPPEAFKSDEFDVRFDIYQLGLTMYRMCNGDELFEKQFARYGTRTSFDRDAFKFDVTNGRFPDRSAFEEHIPARLKRIIKKCLETDPANRYAAVIEVANDLAKVNTGFDWEFTTDVKSRTWSHTRDGKTYELAVDQSGASIAYKTVGSGRRTRVTGYCKERITSTEIRRFLQENEE